MSQRSLTSLAGAPSDEVSRHARVYNFTQALPFQAVYWAATFYALFADDTRLAFFDSGADDVFFVITSVVFFMFIIELLLLSLSKPGYFDLSGCQRSNLKLKRAHKLLMIGSFYFWLDLIATLSLIPEVWAAIALIVAC